MLLRHCSTHSKVDSRSNELLLKRPYFFLLTTKGPQGHWTRGVWLHCRHLKASEVSLCMWCPTAEQRRVARSGTCSRSNAAEPWDAHLGLTHLVSNSTGNPETVVPESCEEEPGNTEWVLKPEGLMIKHPLLKGGDVRKKGKLKKTSSIKLPGFRFLLINGVVIQRSLLSRTCLWNSL